MSDPRSAWASEATNALGGRGGRRRFDAEPVADGHEAVRGREARPARPERQVKQRWMDMSGEPRGWLRRSGLALALALICALGVAHHAVARDAGPGARFAYVTFNAGWNIVSFARGGDYSGEVIRQHSDNVLYTLRPNVAAYAVAGPATTLPGYGYWLHVSTKFQVLLDVSDIESTTLNVPAGQCALVGNPSTKGSAHVRGADRVYEFSPITNAYIATSLIGVGRGALVCNDTGGGVVSVSYEGDAPNVPWPDCCQDAETGASPNNGEGFITFQNNLNAPLIVSARQLDAAGGALNRGDVISGFLAGCAGCNAGNTPRSGCSNIGVTVSFSLAPGAYALHLQPEQPDEKDIQFTIEIAADTRYTLCVGASAPRAAGG